MIAVILSAGLGNRMRPLTDGIPKALLKINGQTIIGRILDSLRENGVTRLVIVTGYLAATLRSYISEHYPDFRVSYVHNERYEETNNVYSLSLAFNSVEIDDDILLIESDVVVETTLVRQLLDSPFPNVALLDMYRLGMDGTVVSLKDSVITGIYPTHLQGIGFDFSDKYKTVNLYRFSRLFCESIFKNVVTYYAKVVDENSFYELILGILIYVGKATIHGQIANGLWTEVDDPYDLSDAEFIFNPPARAGILNTACGSLWKYEVLDFCYIRNTYFPPSSFQNELQKHLPSLMFSYGSRQDQLNLKLAWFLRCGAEQVTLLNGASQIYPLLPELLQCRQPLIPKPTFGEYTRIFPNAQTYRDDCKFHWEEIEIAAQGCDCMVFVNPNNPTGTVLSTPRIYDFALRYPEKRVLIDESFLDFSSESSILTLFRKRPLENVVVLKSLSKVLGVPGLRLGFVYTHDCSFTKAVRARIPIWNSNSIAEFFLELLLKYRNQLAQSLQRTIEDREDFLGELSGLPFIEKVWPSAANFVLTQLRIPVGGSTEFARELLSRHAIYVKDEGPRFEGAPILRLAVRGKNDRLRLLGAMQDVATSLFEHS